MKLTTREKENIIKLIQEGKTIPSHYKSKLFDEDDSEYVEATKDYKLIYKGKEPKERIIANTPAAPLQKVRSFNSNNYFEDSWQNMLIFGDNLLALKAIYDDQRGPNIYKTKNKIKLIYIDPPFATKQDFMKDREKAYRDKIIGAKFIEFLRKRLILLREILADDGSIYVHLDWKKGHYIKAIMDEVFGEHNFLNHISWCYKEREIAKRHYNQKQDYILFYAKNKNAEYTFNWDLITIDYSKGTIGKYNLIDENGRPFQIRGKGGDFTGKQGLPLEVEKEYPNLVYRDYLDEKKGIMPRDWWADIPFVNRAGTERRVTNAYPTQKPEKLLERIILASSNKGDIVCDAFAGSATTLAVAEKLGRRWVGCDSGKLSVYTMQKRILNLTNHIGSLKKDDRREHDRIDDFDEHIKKSRGLFLVLEKAKKGDLIITDSMLTELAKFIESHMSGNSIKNFSICCTREKFKIKKLKAIDNFDDSVGDKIVTIGTVNFFISFINPKANPDREKSIKAKEFALYNAGIYDNQAILHLDWNTYKPFVMKLFNVRPKKHKIHGLVVDGYIGTYDAYIWNYPDYKNLVLDRSYVETLHNVLGGKGGDRFYVIAPVTAMDFMEDEIKIGNTIYVFLKVPLSVLQALIEKGEAGSLKQPTSEDDVNEVIDAVGFDFISQPKVKAKYFREQPINPSLEDQDKKDFVIEIKEFKSDTLVYDPEDFENFETLSMVMVDNNFNDDYFNLSHVFWSDKILDEDEKKAVIRIPQDEFEGEKMMLIYMDKYGNELKIVKLKEDFDEPRVQKRRSSSKSKRTRKK